MTEVISLVLSGLALLISVGMAYRQLQLTRHTNLLPIVIDLFKEFREQSFRQHMLYIQEQLWAGLPPETAGVRDMSDDMMRHIAPVATLFNTVGVLVATGAVEAQVPVALMGASVLRAWYKLSPYIRNERTVRQDPNYYGFFEHLACIAEITTPSQLKSRMKLREMPVDWSFDRIHAFERAQSASALDAPEPKASA